MQSNTNHAKLHNCHKEGHGQADGYEAAICARMLLHMLVSVLVVLCNVEECGRVPFLREAL